MEKELNLGEQEDQNLGTGEENHSDEKGEGGAEDATPKVKIGDAEYTTEQLTEIIGKGTKYDELLPDYTKKSQELAKITKSKEGEHAEDDTTPIYARKGWKPNTFEELQQAIMMARKDGANDALKTLEERETQAAKVKTDITSFFTDIKKSNKDFDEQDFSDFVLEHTKEKEDVNLTDLKMLYSVYKGMDEATRLGEENARKNRGLRTEKVNKGGNEGGGQGVNLSELRGTGSIRDIARAALEKFK